MSAKEKLDQAITELKKMKPYLDKTVGAVKSASMKVSETTVPFIKQSYSKIKTEWDTQIKKYHSKKESPEEKKPENKDQPPKF